MLQNSLKYAIVKPWLRQSRVCLLLCFFSQVNQVKAETPLESCMERCEEASDYATAMLRSQSAQLTLDQVTTLTGKFDMILIECRRSCRKDPYWDKKE